MTSPACNGQGGMSRPSALIPAAVATDFMASVVTTKLMVMGAPMRGEVVENEVSHGVAPAYARQQAGGCLARPLLDTTAHIAPPAPEPQKAGA